MQIQSIPIDPPMPNRPQYSVYDIATVHHFQSRDEYLKLFGVQAPPFDHTRKPKFWFDSGVSPDGVAEYNVVWIDSSGQPVYIKIVMPGAEADSVNMPGSYQYFPRLIQPTAAKLILNGTGMPVGMREVSLEAEAQAMVAALAPIFANLSLKYRLGAVAPPDFYDYPDHSDPRRVYELYDATGNQELPPTFANVGELLYDMNELGVGAPGHWERDTQGGPGWKHDIAIEQPTDPKLMTEWPTPVRQLLPGEHLVLSFGGTLTIQQDALMPKTNFTGGGFTDADRAAIAANTAMTTETHALMLALAKRIGL
jgi:hypothetical protein